MADEHPDVVRRLEQEWWAEAERNNVLPMADGLSQRLGSFVPREYAVPPQLLLRPAGSPVSDDALPMLAGGGWVMADVDVPADGGQGVLFALGDWTGGIAAYVTEGQPVVAVCLPGVDIVQRDGQRLPPGRPDRLGMHQIDGGTPSGWSWTTTSWRASAPIGMPLAWQHGGTSLTLGADRGLPLTSDYAPPYPWTGRLHSVLLSARHQLPPDQEHARVALQVD